MRSRSNPNSPRGNLYHHQQQQVYSNHYPPSNSSDDDGEDWCMVYENQTLSLEHGLAPPTLSTSLGDLPVGDESMLPPHPNSNSPRRHPDGRKQHERQHRRRRNAKSHSPTPPQYYHPNFHMEANPAGKRLNSPRSSRKKRLQHQHHHGSHYSSSSKSSSSWWYHIIQNDGTLILAVVLWYSLGVISISTSKILLTPSKHHIDSPRYYYHVGGVPPLLLTLQQLLLGSTLLRVLLELNFMGSKGFQSWGTLNPTQHNQQTQSLKQRREKDDIVSSIRTVFQFSETTTIFPLASSQQRLLLKGGIAFTIGFVATNLGFSASAASFVETIKAAEPLSSAFLAVSWGLETLTIQEMASLGSIVAGVILSTIGNSSSSSSSSPSSPRGGIKYGSSADGIINKDEMDYTNWSAIVTNPVLLSSLLSCGIVLMSNLCFSFRGLYQKLFRKEHNKTVFDDLNLQYRMQQTGFILLVVPTLLWNGLGILLHLFYLVTNLGIFTSIYRVGFKYCGLALMNGIAFTSYK